MNIVTAENVLGIIGCIVLADELSYVLPRDRDLYKVFIVDNEAGMVLREKLSLDRVDTELLTVNELDRARSQDRYSVLIWMNPADPDSDRAVLTAMIKEAAEALSGNVGLCLCFYGLCHNALQNIERLGEVVGLPMIMLTDLRGEPVDDCLGANLGGRKEYLEAIVNNPGTIFASPGYAENWHRMWGGRPEGGRAEGVESMRSLCKETGVSKIMRLDNGLGERTRFERRVEAFARMFGLDIVSRECGLGVFEHTYSLAKKRLAMMRPLSLAPQRGMGIVPSHNFG